MIGAPINSGLPLVFLLSLAHRLLLIMFYSDSRFKLVDACLLLITALILLEITVSPVFGYYPQYPNLLLRALPH